MFQELFHQLSEQLRDQLPGHRFAFKHKLASLDSTRITLCARSFPWAHYQRTKGAVKLHLLLDHAGHMPFEPPEALSMARPAQMRLDL